MKREDLGRGDLGVRKHVKLCENFQSLAKCQGLGGFCHVSTMRAGVAEAGAGELAGGVDKVSGSATSPPLLSAAVLLSLALLLLALAWETSLPSLLYPPFWHCELGARHDGSSHMIPVKLLS